MLRTLDRYADESIIKWVWKDADSQNLNCKLCSKGLALVEHVSEVILRTRTCDDLEVVVHEVGLLLPLDELLIDVIVQPLHLVHPS
mgnify:CR=1 FL=1